MKEQLTTAIINGDVNFIQDYFTQGGKLDKLRLTAPNGYGVSPVELAATSHIHHQGNAQVVSLIVKNSSEDVLAESFIRFSSEDDNTAEVKSLLEAGVPVDIIHQNRTALQRATGNRNLKMVHLLLTYGADPNKEGEYGTALKEAKSIRYEPAYLGMMESFLEENPKSPFDFVNTDAIKSQLKDWLTAIHNFEKSNNDQKFYIIAIDGGRLSANSEEAFEATLKKYREDFTDSYREENEVQRLKFSAGDFSYHNIHEMKEITLDTNNLDYSFLEPLPNDARTKKELLTEGLLLNKELFRKELNTTDDFKIQIFNHTY